MLTRRLCTSSVAITLVLTASSAFGVTMNEIDYANTKDQIHTDYKADIAACISSVGPAKDVCTETARGKRQVAYAQLEYDHSGLADDARKLDAVKVNSSYAIARQSCADLQTSARNACMADAKSNWQVASGKITPAQGALNPGYRAAREKCNDVVGDAHTACISDAKAHFNKN